VTAAAAKAEPMRVPRDPQNDYTREMAAVRRDFVRDQTGADLSHLGGYSFDPAILPGNIENFAGVAQVPVGVAGPIRIHGEHARGDFYVPLATTEGSLVASYNRGMRLLTECGGVTTTVVEEHTQRSPVFVFRSALEAREFGRWVDANLGPIRRAAEATTRTGRLAYIGQQQVGPLRYLRFNYTTGDSAGRNMASKATAAACEWIRKNYSAAVKYVLSGIVESDKKHAWINTLLTRGKRVVAEIVVSRHLLRSVMGIEVMHLFALRQIHNAGSFLAGCSGLAAHPADALAALFIATGQDAANVAESHTAFTYTQILDNGDLYWSITLPSLVVATCGGGTGLATQRQCLEMMGCYGKDKAKKFAEVCAAVVLAGEASLASAALAGGLGPCSCAAAVSPPADTSRFDR
jgi:hydroxymethylglutaryl-CoA reductase (NADPH)